MTGIVLDEQMLFCIVAGAGVLLLFIMMLVVVNKISSLQQRLSDAELRLRNEQINSARALHEDHSGASERIGRDLQELHHTLGELQSLAGGVDDLKRIMGNVKTRGIWGEMQLGNILTEILPRDCFAENVEIVPGSNERVEFAVSLPGDGQQLWLPIDSKFPQEDYLRLQLARESGDRDGMDTAVKALEKRVREEAREIYEKYVRPPYSTDFGVLFLPTEDLFITVLGLPGVADELQRKFHVVAAGPSTLAALLNALSMGFRTLAVQARSSEIEHAVAGVLSELDRAGNDLQKLSRKILEVDANRLEVEKDLARIKKMLA